ncbi:MAG: hypothetical protein BWY77_02002 [bacterium ADurb.Bin431]|nr:MAG: hypothetical protein BWY77_02002 [bacterium ADurb.Bin431]
MQVAVSVPGALQAVPAVAQQKEGRAQGMDRKLSVIPPGQQLGIGDLDPLDRDPLLQLAPEEGGGEALELRIGGIQEYHPQLPEQSGIPAGESPGETGAGMVT